jgi:hypothetical protein
MPVFRQSRETKWTFIVSDGQNFGKMACRRRISPLKSREENDCGIAIDCRGGQWRERPLLEEKYAYQIPEHENNYHMRLPKRMI